LVVVVSNANIAASTVVSQVQTAASTLVGAPVTASLVTGRRLLADVRVLLTLSSGASAAAVQAFTSLTTASLLASLRTMDPNAYASASVSQPASSTNDSSSGSSMGLVIGVVVGVVALVVLIAVVVVVRRRNPPVSDLPTFKDDKVSGNYANPMFSGSLSGHPAGSPAIKTFSNPTYDSDYTAPNPYGAVEVDPSYDSGEYGSAGNASIAYNTMGAYSSVNGAVTDEYST